MIRALIPGLYNREQPTSFLSQEQQSTFYECGLLPAIQQILGHEAAEWPAKYKDEMFRARGRNGQLSFQTKTFPKELVKDLGQCIREALLENSVEWGDGIVFLHQIRGMKHSSRHPPSEEVTRLALEEFLYDHGLPGLAVGLDEPLRGRWWIDVGLEFSSEGEEEQSIAWLTSSHRHITQKLCQLDEANAERITTPGSSKYERDMASHLTGISGCRITPGVRGQGPNKVSYLQMYHTDKALIYRLDQGRYGKFTTGADALNGKALGFIENLYALYRNAIKANHSAARLEVRVPLQFSTMALLDLAVDLDLLTNSLASVPSVAWWWVTVFYFSMK